MKNLSRLLLAVLALGLAVGSVHARSKRMIEADEQSPAPAADKAMVVFLRDSFGIVFEGIDYDRIALADRVQPGAVGDICVVDPDRRALLAEAVAGLDIPVGEAARKFRAVPSARSGA